MNYSPRGVSDLSVKSRDACYGIKDCKVNYINKFVYYLKSSSKEFEILSDYINPEVILVPLPGSSPLKEGTLWRPDFISQVLKKEKLVMNVERMLIRAYPVPKSSSSPKGERPTVLQHYDSFKVVKSLNKYKKITLFDDVITKGATFFAAAMKIKEILPEIEINAFAVVRTQSDHEIEKIVNPSIGLISYNKGIPRREP